MKSYFKWIGAALGVIGCYALAFNHPLSKYAFIIYFFSSAILLYVAAREKDYQYVVLNSAFLGGNILAIYMWVLK